MRAWEAGAKAKPRKVRPAELSFLSNAKNAFERQGTAKELDEETGLYYYRARYLDTKYSMWLSCDPALGEYMASSSAG